MHATSAKGALGRSLGLLAAVGWLLAGVVGCSDSSEGFLVGDGVAVVVNPSAVAFSDVPRDGEARRNVVVRHAGTTGVIILSPIRLETTSSDIKIGAVDATELAPGEEARIQLVYLSGDDAPDEGTLVIGTNIQNDPELRIPVTTPGQRAQLVANPVAVDFGVTQGGVAKAVTVQVVNNGTVPGTLTGYEVQSDPDGDFGVELTEGTEILPGETVGLDFTYTPSGVDADAAVVTLLTDREDVVVAVPVEGEEETPIIRVQPATMQFGWVEPGASRNLKVEIWNDGNKDLEVTDIELLGGGAHLFITGELDLPVTLKPQADVLSFGVMFMPNAEIAMTADPMATLSVTSSDVARSPMDVPVFGAAGTPGIQVIPSQVVDFAYVAEGFTGKRTVSVINVGNSTVAVTGASIQDATSTEFSFPDDDLLPVSLLPGESVALEVRFYNSEGTEGTETARFVLETTDPLVPVYPLDVIAKRAERPTCEPAFVPEILALGAFKAGTVGEGTMQIVNYGSGNCQFQEYDLVGCNKIQSFERHYFDCDPLKPWTPFEVTNAPGWGAILGPGEAIDFDVNFTAPPVKDEVVGRDSYFARLGLTFHDPNLPGFKYLGPPGGWMGGVNLRAESGQPILDVTPSEVDFGVVRMDCESEGRLVSLSNVGPMPATVSEVELIGCGGQVTLTNLPELPLEVGPFKTHFLQVTFGPDAAGTQACQLRVLSDSLHDPEVHVDLSGDGLDISHHTDTFDQVPPPKVDVMFVVDDSGSMADEQKLLSDQLPILVDMAISWGQDYHLAVTTTDTVVVSGRFQGSPVYTTPVHETEAFQVNLLVGTGGHFEEMGLEAAWMALSGNNYADTDITCIPNIPNQCPTGLACRQGYCRGYNYGFLREDAELVIIIVSDEEDSSPESVDWYVSRFAALKDPQKGVGAKVHAIIYPASGCPGSNFGSVGYRYIQTANKLNGHVAPICSNDFVSEFEDIGEKTFGLKTQFYPTLPPDPATLVVRVNGQACADGWEWNAATKAVVFEEDHACFPPFGSEVEIEYDVFCAQPASAE